MESFLRSVALLFTLLNPFLMSVYLSDLIQKLERMSFSRVILRASLISGVVFALFAVLGERVFRDILQARFAAFLVFGGVVFLVISIRFVLAGVEALEALRGPSEHLAGSVAMPFMIGPGTVSASVLIGARLAPGLAVGAVAAALLAVFVSMVAFKWLHDWVRRENEALVARYTEITGRVTALVMGTYSVDLILRGLELWFNEVNPPL